MNLSNLNLSSHPNQHLRKLEDDVQNVLAGRKNTNADTSDNVYYNITIENKDEPDGKKVRFSENRVTPILNTPSNYECACVRLLVPSVNIPLLFFPSDNFYVKLNYGGFTSGNIDLIYTPNSFANPYANVNKRPVYDYSEITSSLNDALATAKGVLDGLAPVGLFNDPVMTYDSGSELFTLNCEIAGYDESLGAGNFIEIIFSAKVFEYYANLSDFFLNPFETRIKVYDQFNNTITFQGQPTYAMVQSQPSLELFSDLQKIVITSSSIPIVQELQGTQDDVTRRVLFDFNVSGKADKGVITFFPQGPIRYYDLSSNYPLKSIDVEFFWENKSGELFDIFINKDTSATLKIAFKKKISLRLDGL